MRWVVLLVIVAGCRQLLGLHDIDTDAGFADGPRFDASDAPSSDATDATAACWTFTPTNFDPCGLPSPQPMIVVGNIQLDTDTMGTTLAQGDGTEAAIVHVSSLTIGSFATLDITGTRPLILAVDGPIDLPAGAGILVEAGRDDVIHCAVPAGAGGDSNAIQGGAGGGGGGPGAQASGSGASGQGNGKGMRGLGSPAIIGADSLSPLRGGCSGAKGGQSVGGTRSTGGVGGGGVQLVSQQGITIEGKLVASGGGGASGNMGLSSGDGGGGGGGGGAVFVEGATVTLASSSVTCADGGSGGQGGSSNKPGTAGVSSPCTGTAGAVTPTDGSAGGAGGAGGFAATAPTTPNGGGAGGDAGGGGGGGVGWIRIRSALAALAVDPSAVVTPTPTVN